MEGRIKPRAQWMSDCIVSAHSSGLVPPAIVTRDSSSSWEKPSFPRTIAPPDRICTADTSRDQVARCSSWWTEIVTLLQQLDTSNITSHCVLAKHCGTALLSCYTFWISTLLQSSNSNREWWTATRSYSGRRLILKTHCPNSSVEVKNKWSSTAIIPICLYDIHKDNPIFLCFTPRNQLRNSEFLYYLHRAYSYNQRTS